MCEFGFLVCIHVVFEWGVLISFSECGIFFGPLNCYGFLWMLSMVWSKVGMNEWMNKNQWNLGFLCISSIFFPLWSPMCMYMQLDSLVNSVLYSLTLWKVVEFMLVPFGKLLHLCWCLAVDVLLVLLMIMAVYAVVENSEMNNLREVNLDFAKVFSHVSSCSNQSDYYYFFPSFSKSLCLEA